MKITDYNKIERAAKEAIRNIWLTSGTDDFSRDVSVAIAAALKEYDEQKKKEKA